LADRSPEHYILLLGMLAAFTAYARHLLTTVITLEIPSAAGRVATRSG
jgi:hypothetical protein